MGNTGPLKRLSLMSLVAHYLTTVWDTCTSLPGIQTYMYFIYSSWIIGKAIMDLHRKDSVFKANLNLAYIHHGLSVSHHGFPGKTKAFKAKLAMDNHYGL